MRNDPAKKIIATVVIVVVVMSLLGAKKFWFLIVGMILLSGCIAYFTQTKCPSCQARGTLAHLHQRIDGDPDRRFRENPVLCRNCGWPQIPRIESPKIE